jgi:hypothetical protein
MCIHALRSAEMAVSLVAGRLQQIVRQEGCRSDGGLSVGELDDRQFRKLFLSNVVRKRPVMSAALADKLAQIMWTVARPGRRFDARLGAL